MYTYTLTHTHIHICICIYLYTCTEYSLSILKYTFPKLFQKLNSQARFFSLKGGKREIRALESSFWKQLPEISRGIGYRVAKTHRIPYLCRSFSEKETYNEWLFCGKKPTSYGILRVFATLYTVHLARNYRAVMHHDSCLMTHASFLISLRS